MSPCLFAGCGNLCSRTGLNGGTSHVRFSQRTNHSDIPTHSLATLPWEKRQTIWSLTVCSEQPGGLLCNWKSGWGKGASDYYYYYYYYLHRISVTLLTTCCCFMCICLRDATSLHKTSFSLHTQNTHTLHLHTEPPCVHITWYYFQTTTYALNKPSNTAQRRHWCKIIR